MKDQEGRRWEFKYSFKSKLLNGEGSLTIIPENVLTRENEPNENIKCLVHNK